MSSRQTTEVYNPKLTQLTLAELRPAKAYDLRMFAINSVGRSDTSNVLTFTTKEAGRFTHIYCFQKYFEMCRTQISFDG